MHHSTGLIIAVVLACTCATIVAQRTATPAEKLGLEALYHAANGSGWFNQNGWMSGDPCTNGFWVDPRWNSQQNSWYGVICEPGRRLQIFLRRNNLSGYLPDEFSQLVFSSVDMSDNQLKGQIPEMFADSLDLSSNQLTGEIPKAWTGWRMTSLNLARNKLVGTIPGVNFHSIDLSGNQLSGTLPVSWSNVPFDQIYLRDNMFTGTIPSMGKVTMLDLSNNRLGGVLIGSSFKRMAVYDLRLNGNMFAGTIPSELGQYESSVLHLANNQFTGTIPLSLSNVTTLSDVNFANNKLTGALSFPLHMPRLRRLNVTNNALSGSVSELWASKEWFALDLSRNLFNGQIPSNWSSNPNIQFFDIGCNCFTDKPPVWCANATCAPCRSEVCLSAKCRSSCL